MKPWIKKIYGTFLLATMASPAFADISMPTGWYVEALLGKMRVIQDDASGSSSVSGTVTEAATVGYKYMPYMGVEAGYLKLQDTSSTFYKNNHHAYYIAFKAMVPVENTGFEPYSKLGVQRLTSRFHPNSSGAAQGFGSFNKSTSGLYLAVGADFYFWSAFATGLEWQRIKGNSSTGTFDVYSIGVTYIIG